MNLDAAVSGSPPPPSDESLLTDSLLPAVRELLGTDCNADLDTPILQLGLNSFQVLGLLEHMAKTLELEIPITFSFECPTLRKMASKLGKLRSDSKNVCRLHTKVALAAP